MALLAACALVGVPAQAQDGKRSATGEGHPADTVVASIVHVRVKALPDARSNATLGRDREGTGVVIDGGGHVLTIGYLVIEAEAIEVTTADEKTLPATLAGYDHASGFGLLKVSQPAGLKPIELGSAAALSPQDPVMVLPHGGRGNAQVARVAARRPFSGSWEYLLDDAIYVSPPTMNWAGAALISREFKLVGIGSLFLRDMNGSGVGGNMFVPVDLLKPILADLVASGKRSGPVRPWLGLATEEFHGRLLVVRVSPESPAEKAGLKAGDIVLGVGKDTVRNHVELYGKVWGTGAAGADIPLKVLQGADLRDIRVKSIDRAEYFRDRPVH